MIQKYWPYLLIFFCIVLLIFGWPLSKNRSLIWTSKISQKISTSSIIQKPLFISHGSRDSQKIALTFDADLTPYMSDELKSGKISTFFDQGITDYLVSQNISATIFVTGLWAQQYSSQLKQIAQNPLFEIGNHSYSHLGFTKNCYSLGELSDDKKNDDIKTTQKIIQDITGIVPKYFRFPGGCYDQKDIDLVLANNLNIVAWDVVSSDSFNNNSQNIINRVLSQTQNGSIIVMHLNGAPNAPKTRESLATIIPELKKKGFEFVKLSDLPLEK